MAVGGEDERKKIFKIRKMNPREVTTKYGRLDVLKRHDFSEIWGFRYRLTLGIGTLKF
jgi:hypothetical protein